MKAYWTEDSARWVTDDASLDAVFAEVSALGAPTMVFLEHADGRTLVVGVGGEETVLTYVSASGASYHSVGDPGRQGVLKFWCRDQVDDFIAGMAVPASVGIEAARWFQTNGDMPLSVKWEPDW